MTPDSSPGTLTRGPPASRGPCVSSPPGCTLLRDVPFGGLCPPSPLPPPLSRSFPKGPHATWLCLAGQRCGQRRQPRLSFSQNRWSPPHSAQRLDGDHRSTDQQQQHQIPIALTSGPGPRLALSRRHDSKTAKTQKNGNAQQGGGCFTGQVFFRHYNSCYRNTCPSSNCRWPCNSVRGNADTRGRTAEKDTLRYEASPGVPSASLHAKQDGPRDAQGRCRLNTGSPCPRIIQHFKSATMEH